MQTSGNRDVIIGAGGQLGREPVDELPDAVSVDLPYFDLTDPASVVRFGWSGADSVYRDSGYTVIDNAEGDRVAASAGKGGRLVFGRRRPGRRSRDERRRGGQLVEPRRRVFRHAGQGPDAVTEATKAVYLQDKPNIAVRPANSVLDLSKLHDLGACTPDWKQSLATYLEGDS